jgi:hypothetical protein
MEIKPKKRRNRRRCVQPALGSERTNTVGGERPTTFWAGFPEESLAAAERRTQMYEKMFVLLKEAIGLLKSPLTTENGRACSFTRKQHQAIVPGDPPHGKRDTPGRSSSVQNESDPKGGQRHSTTHDWAPPGSNQERPSVVMQLDNQTQ